MEWKPYFYDILGQRLRQARRSAGLTQAQVAQILGKPRSYVSQRDTCVSLEQIRRGRRSRLCSLWDGGILTSAVTRGQRRTLIAADFLASLTRRVFGHLAGVGL